MAGGRFPISGCQAGTTPGIFPTTTVMPFCLGRTQCLQEREQCELPPGPGQARSHLPPCKAQPGQDNLLSEWSVGQAPGVPVFLPQGHVTPHGVLALLP